MKQSGEVAAKICLHLFLTAMNSQSEPKWKIKLPELYCM
jgi:hypothetical protein